VPTKRRKVAPRLSGLTPAAVDAWRAGDYMALHRALGLSPWDASPLPLSVTPLGCDQRTPEQNAKMAYEHRLYHATWPKALQLQLQLMAIAGNPGRVGRHGKPLGAADADEA
jgi:hypothetical protein